MKLQETIETIEERTYKEFVLESTEGDEYVVRKEGDHEQFVLVVNDGTEHGTHTVLEPAEAVALAHMLTWGRLQALLNTIDAAMGAVNIQQDYGDVLAPLIKARGVFR